MARDSSSCCRRRNRRGDQGSGRLCQAKRLSRKNYNTSYVPGASRSARCPRPSRERLSLRTCGRVNEYGCSCPAGRCSSRSPGALQARSPRTRRCRGQGVYRVNDAVTLTSCSLRLAAQLRVRCHSLLRCRARRCQPRTSKPGRSSTTRADHLDAALALAKTLARRSSWVVRCCCKTSSPLGQPKTTPYPASKWRRT